MSKAVPQLALPIIRWLPSRMTVLGYTAGTFQSQDLNSNGSKGILYPAFRKKLAVWPWPWLLMCRDIQPAGLFCFLQFSADLWAAVVGKCQVINNSYTSAEAAEREMPLGNGMSDKSRFHNSAVSHNTISLFWVYGKLVILHKCGRSLPLLGHMTQRYTWFKNEAILLLSRVGQVDHRKERNNGLYIYKRTLYLEVSQDNYGIVTRYCSL